MLLQAPLPSSSLVVAIDPGKVVNRVRVSDGDGLVIEPVSIPVSRAGIEKLERSIKGHAAGRGQVVIAIEATGSLHRAWATELERLPHGCTQADHARPRHTLTHDVKAKRSAPARSLQRVSG